MLVLAHPLHAHRPAGYRDCDQGGIGGRVVGRVVPVATGALHVNAAHRIWRQAQQFGYRTLQRIDALAVRPHRQLAAIVERHGTRRADGSVHLIRPPIARFDAPGFGARRRVAANLVIVVRQALQLGVQIGFRGERYGFVPGRAAAEQAHRADGLILALGDDGKEAAVANDFEDAGHFFRRAAVQRS